MLLPKMAGTYDSTTTFLGDIGGIGIEVQACWVMTSLEIQVALRIKLIFLAKP